MKSPKEPKTFKRPRLYYQEGLPFGEYMLGPRVRIIYPDGSCEFLSIANRYYDNSWNGPCWADRFDDWVIGMGYCADANSAVKKMKKYDLEMGFPKAEFLGEL